MMASFTSFNNGCDISLGKKLPSLGPVAGAHHGLVVRAVEAIVKQQVPDVWWWVEGRSFCTVPTLDA